jgi:hypothetical protein
MFDNNLLRAMPRLPETVHVVNACNNPFTFVPVIPTRKETNYA